MLIKTNAEVINKKSDNTIIHGNHAREKRDSRVSRVRYFNFEFVVHES